MSIPKDKQLYDSIATYIKAKYKPSANLSFMFINLMYLVNTYSLDLFFFFV